MTTVYEVLRKSLDAEIDSVKDALANGSAKTYDEYQKMCGTIKGFKIAYNLVLNLEDNENTMEDLDG